MYFLVQKMNLDCWCPRMRCNKPMRGGEDGLLCTVEQEDQVVGELDVLRVHQYPHQFKHHSTAEEEQRDYQGLQQAGLYILFCTPDGSFETTSSLVFKK